MRQRRSRDAADSRRSSDRDRDDRHDLLRAAAEGLRDPEPASPRLVRATRARILSDLHAQRRRRSSRVAVLVPLAAILVGSTAWAGATGRLQQMLHDAMETIVRADGSAEPTAAAEPAGVRPQTAADRELGSEPPPAAVDEKPGASEDRGTEAAAEPSAEPRDDDRAAPQHPAQGPAAAAGAEPAGTSSAADDAELVAYRSAHRLHFGGAGATETITAWDEYLTRWPAGRFALEARYNRAVCLVRTGRSAEAVQALRPFAQGRYGAYRQAEAERLIEALQSKGD